MIIRIPGAIKRFTKLLQTSGSNLSVFRLPLILSGLHPGSGFSGFEDPPLLFLSPPPLIGDVSGPQNECIGLLQGMEMLAHPWEMLVLVLEMDT